MELSEQQRLDNFVEFRKIWTENVKREGADRFLAWLETTDFFRAPCSTQYHLATAGGLCLHSLNVHQLLVMNINRQTFSDKFVISYESAAICGLGHDLCKVNFYEIEMRNKKIDGRWQEVPFYKVKDQFPFGHGEKSVFLLERFFKLKPEEAMAIRWHMAAWDAATYGQQQALSNAGRYHPLVALLQMADVEATYILEREEDDGAK